MNKASLQQRRGGGRRCDPARLRSVFHFLLCCTSFILHSSSFAADVPAAINYQGTLVNRDGLAVTSGAYRVAFRIWDDATGTGAAHLVWGRVYQVYAMTGGVFNVLLTDAGGTAVTDPAPRTNDLLRAFEGANRYLGLTLTETPTGPVGSPAEMVPRQQLASAPYVFRAGRATDAQEARDGFRVSKRLVVASGGLEVTGAAVLHSTLAVSGAATFKDTLVVTNNLVATNQTTQAHGLHVYAGDTQIAGAVTVAGNVTVDPPSGFTGHGTVPVGAIIMWSGAIHTIPRGWALCDGGTHSGHTTPDLRDRFVVGAGQSYAHGDTGGANFHQLTIAEMPDHHHAYDYRSENKGYWGLAEKHDGFWKNTKDENSGHAGGDQPHENRPPYYALCYIMRVQ
ncbi:MAG: tail fiber protein [Candidatus Marinimicrobia bacterium]|nr:tail fiber protein [Candidatus Neomarinimicrobiota bacterium]